MKKPKEESETERKGVTKKKARGKRLRLKENQKQKDRDWEKGRKEEKEMCCLGMHGVAALEPWTVMNTEKEQRKRLVWGQRNRRAQCDVCLAGSKLVLQLTITQLVWKGLSLARVDVTI